MPRYITFNGWMVDNSPDDAAYKYFATLQDKGTNIVVKQLKTGQAATIVVDSVEKGRTFLLYHVDEDEDIVSILTNIAYSISRAITIESVNDYSDFRQSGRKVS